MKRLVTLVYECYLEIRRCQPSVLVRCTYTVKKKTEAIKHFMNLKEVIEREI